MRVRCREEAMKPKIKVLVVDDEKQFAENLCRLLSFRDIDATAVFDGNQAIETLKSSTDLCAVVLDIKMPGMDGIETLGKIKKINPEIEVIMLTGHADIESGTQAIRKGAYDYLMKPCDIEALAEKLREAMQAEKIKQYPVLWPRKFVKQISLAGFIRLETRDLLNKAVEIFEEINRGPTREELHVLDNEDRLAGIITRSDLIREAYNENPELYCSWNELAKHPEWLPLKRIDRVMRPAPHIFAHADEKLTQVAQRMFDHNLRYLPILTDGKMTGIIKLKDILKHTLLDENF